MRALAILEGDDARSAAIQSLLESAGFRAERFRDAESALTTLRRRAFSLAILDLDGAEGSAGSDPLATCREASRLLPVIALISEPDEEARVRTLEAGADDCISHPVAGRELVARIRNLLRRAEGDHPGERDLETLSVSIREMRIRDEGGMRDLTRGETEVLEQLLAHAPAPVTVARLADVLPVKRSTIESRIKSLRRKLGPGRLVSRGRLGYQLE
jgi:DNA-binding response OmpR family regulator